MTDAPPPEGEGTPDVVDRALGSLDHLLDVIHDNVLRPILLGGRFVAYGFLLAAVTVTVIVAILIAMTRFLNVYLFPGREWATYWLLGTVLLTTGLVIWRYRRPVRLRDK